jgi:hypothetical protein
MRSFKTGKGAAADTGVPHPAPLLQPVHLSLGCCGMCPRELQWGSITQKCKEATLTSWRWPTGNEFLSWSTETQLQVNCAIPTPGIPLGPGEIRAQPNFSCASHSQASHLRLSLNKSPGQSQALIPRDQTFIGRKGEWMITTIFLRHHYVLDTFH